MCTCKKHNFNSFYLKKMRGGVGYSFSKHKRVFLNKVGKTYDVSKNVKSLIYPRK